MFCLEYIHGIVSAQKVRCVMLVLDAYITHYSELFKWRTTSKTLVL